MLSGTLLIKRLPLAPAALLPEGWQIPFTLRPTARAVAAGMFPGAYQPEATQDTHDGVTLHVLKVANTAVDSAVQVEITWRAPDREGRYLRGLGERRLLALSDNVGHVYGSPMPRTRPKSDVTGQQGAVTTAQEVGVL